LTGVELCRRIRSEESTAMIPVILLTAKSFEFDDELIAELKLSALLPKPFSPRELVALVDRCLENHVVPQA
jgi:two-component system alkaline phosphatase synthesis response regulator PhoP